MDGKTIRIIQGDITDQKADAIVNAANSKLLGGGGVDGAIHRAGGSSIMAECDRIRKEKGGCPTGTAVATTAGELNARYVIHTAGPVWTGGEKGEAELLASCHRESIRIASDKDCRVIAFPGISIGAYRYPAEQAAEISLATVAAELGESGLEEVRFVLFSSKNYDIYANALERLEK
ncbi:MAG: O-acetyl-ADP-ribose deacetylase [Candidatus Latescibacteria bacterium]|nr:O-acetyl-ADP-ribose deacetylase [bacterium]MBD3425320.1 O-acetyl-ADP-ribose deacetylase [Candidatus Latescibacterota bacterium]